MIDAFGVIVARSIQFAYIAVGGAIVAWHRVTGR